MNNRTINGTNVRKKSIGKKVKNMKKIGRPKLDIKKQILEVLKKSDNPVSTSDLARELEYAWHTIDRACLMLQIDGKIEGFRIGKMNLWRVK